jgi:GNAT superfamily N-acetyltransferase
VIIRFAQINDASPIADLIANLDHHLSEAEIRSNLEQLARECLPQLVAEVDGRIVGLLGLDRMVPVYRPKPVARMTILIVAEAHRGKGIGRALVDRAVAIACDWGCGIIEVTTNERLIDAHAFYRSLGWDQTSKRFALRLD